MFSTRVVVTIAAVFMIATKCLGDVEVALKWVSDRYDICLQYKRDGCLDDAGVLNCFKNAKSDARGAAIKKLDNAIKIFTDYVNDYGSGKPCLTGAVTNEKQKQWLKDLSDTCYNIPNKGNCVDRMGKIACFEKGLTSVQGAALNDIQRAIDWIKEDEYCPKLHQQNTCYTEIREKIILYKFINENKIEDFCRLVPDTLQKLKEIKKDCPKGRIVLDFDFHERMQKNHC